MSKIDEFGGPEAFNHYAVGWAHAMNTPYQWTKQVASHFGGTRNPVDRPLAQRHPGQGRDADTVQPRDRYRADHSGSRRTVRIRRSSNSVQQAPLEGVSMLYCVQRRAKRAEHHETQYFEMFCNRGIYHKGWTAVTRHSTPWEMSALLPAFDDDVWELYDTSKDWTQAHDLAKDHAGETAPPAANSSLIEASKYNVFPLDDRRVERFNPDLAGRPQLIQGNTQLLFGGMGRLTRELGPRHEEQILLGDR